MSSKFSAKIRLRLCTPFMGLVIALAGTSHAAEFSEITAEGRSSQTLSAMSASEFGDSIDYQNGSFGITQNDVSLSGIGPDIRIDRRFNYVFRYPSGVTSQTLDWVSTGTQADWTLELPRLRVRLPLAQYTVGSGGLPAGAVLTPRADWNVAGSNPHARCTNFSSLPTIHSVPGSDWWTGLTMVIPGQATQTVLAKDSTATALPTHLVTNSNWMFTCLPSLKNDEPGEGFLAISPSGTKYWFDWLTFTNYDWISIYSNNKNSMWRSIEASMMVTRIEDVHGNWINYSYDGRYLTNITASDGREVSLAWTSHDWGGGSYLNGQGAFRFLDRVTVQPQSPNPRIWRYVYALETGGWYWRRDGHLRKVIRPDASEWTFNLDPLVKGCYGVAPDGTMSFACAEPPRGKTFDSSITSPSGATATYSFVFRSHKRHLPQGTFYDHHHDHQLGHYLAPTRRRVFGPSVDLTWTYTYTPDYDNGPDNQTPWQWVNTTVTNPDQTKTRYAVNNMYRDRLEGRISKIETLDATGAVVREEVHDYAPPSQGPYPAKVGTSLLAHTGTAGMETYIPLLRRTIQQQGDTYTRLTNNYDVFARTTSLTQYSTGHSKTTLTTYYDNPAKWIYGKVQSTSINGMETQRVEFDNQGRPWRSYHFGKLIQATTYHADGTIATTTDGRGYATAFSNWKRGIPQLIRYPATPEAPEGATKSATVDDNGWITSATDEAGSVTGYGYDTMGRLASIVHPTGDSASYHTTYRNFQPIATGDWKPDGFSVGQWRQIETTGNRTTITYMDALWRPVLKHEYDSQNVAASLRSIKTSYDSNGRITFQSHPSSENIPGNIGTRTIYDALDRVIRVELDAESNTILTTTTEYLSGLKTKVTNPKGFSTTTSFMAWDEPIYDFPILSEQPESKVIQIGRHPQFGWPLQLTQRDAAGTLSATRRYVYDGNAQLCKTIEPEAGVTVMGYDEAGNPTWQAAGLDGNSTSYNSTTDCQHVAAYGAGRTITRAYDTRNRLTHLTFPNGGVGNQIWTYEKDNLPKSITAYNDANNATPVLTTYVYNKRRLLTGESITQHNGTAPWYTWTIGYAYDGYGHLSTQTYPTGLVVDYAPNPLGQPTRAGTYATDAQYYPNGALKQFTYGNGIVHTMTQNARQLPQRVSTTGKAMDYEYGYDPNGNVAHVLDHVTGTPTARHRWMTYDNLDRLTSVASAVFGGSDHTHRFTYDALDNIESWKHAGAKDYADYIYDAQNRLTLIRNAAGAAVVAIDYDEKGNLRNKNGQGYVFDFGNRLRSATGRETYRYDGLGRRVQTTATNGKNTLWQYTQSGQMLFSSDWGEPASPAQQTHESVYLAGSVVAIIDHAWPSNAVMATKYQHTDALGSPVAVTNASGQVIERMEYEPWGTIIGKPNHNGIGYTGHVMDGATGLTYMQQRYYDQSVGRFLSVDPVTTDSGTGANFNRYKYAANNPYRFIDPDGRQERNPDPGLVERLSDQMPFLKWLLSPSDTQAATKGAMIREQLVSENSQPHSAEDVVFYTAIAMSLGTRGVGGRARKSANAAKRAEAARDALGAAKRRRHGTYTGGYKDGRTAAGCSSNPTGCGEDDVARKLGSDAQFTKSYGWRRNPATGEVEWTEIPVCTRCQGKYDPSQFPDDVKHDPDGPWDEKR